MRFRAVLFDFDGVVINSTPVHLMGWEKAYKEVFGKCIDEKVLNSLPGQSTRAIAERLTQGKADLGMMDILIQLKAAFVLENLDKIPLVDGVLEFMNELNENQIPFGIASNAPRNFLRAAIDRHRISCRFYLGLEDYQWPKPHPEAYLKGAECLGWRDSNKEEIAVFEDSAHGIHSAVAAGATPIGITSQHPAELLIQSGAKLCIKNFSEMGDLRKSFYLA